MERGLVLWKRVRQFRERYYFCSFLPFLPRLHTTEHRQTTAAVENLRQPGKIKVMPRLLGGKNLRTSASWLSELKHLLLLQTHIQRSKVSQGRSVWNVEHKLRMCVLHPTNSMLCEIQRVKKSGKGCHLIRRVSTSPEATWFIFSRTQDLRFLFR